MAAASMVEPAPHVKAAWNELMAICQLQFGRKVARAYAFLRLDPLGEDVPILYSAKGPARVVGTLEDQVMVVLERTRQTYDRDLETYSARFAESRAQGRPAPRYPILLAEPLQIEKLGYPLHSPPAWQVQAFRQMGRSLANA